MTARTPTRTRNDALLERILDTVETVDKNVEEILDRLRDHLDGASYPAWYDDSYEGTGYA